jgi:hypothetical protein
MQHYAAIMTTLLVFESGTPDVKLTNVAESCRVRVSLRKVPALSMISF